MDRNLSLKKHSLHYNILILKLEYFKISFIKDFLKTKKIMNFYFSNFIPSQGMRNYYCCLKCFI